MKQNEILTYLKKIKPTFEKKGIATLGLFGSFAKHQESLTSDIDVIFKFKKSFFQNCDPWEYFNIINNLKDNISFHFKIKVDIFDEDSSSPYKTKIIKEAIYV